MGNILWEENVKHKTKGEKQTERKESMGKSQGMRGGFLRIKNNVSS